MTTAVSVFGNVASKAQPTCPFCGKELKTTTITVSGRTFNNLPCFGSCGCDRSAAKNAELEGKGDIEGNVRLRKYAHAGIGEAFFKATVSEPEYYQAVKSGNSLFITGQVGSGKTFLASALAMRLIDSGLKVRFETTVGLLRELRGAVNSKQTDVFERCVGCDVLILDDLGKETPTEFALSVLYEIIDIRYANGLPTIITSNYQGDGLVERMADANVETAKAIVSRICGTCKAVELNEKDWRRA